jgi:hypothetical protein
MFKKISVLHNAMELYYEFVVWSKNQKHELAQFLLHHAQVGPLMVFVTRCGSRCCFELLGVIKPQLRSAHAFKQKLRSTLVNV